VNSEQIFSSTAQLMEIGKILSAYMRLPLSWDTIPGNIMEALLAHVREGTILRKYDFVDVIKPDLKCGWQVKSTRAGTPVTWKRAKIPNREKLITESRKSKKGLQELGDAIIDFCNDHVQASLTTYELEQIGYARLVVHDDGKVVYFERLLATRGQPQPFDPSEFVWNWSRQKETKKKEQLQALHGIHKSTKKKWFAWHGLGENQLHFSGESNWWPKPGDIHAVTFKFPAVEDRIGLDKFMDFLSRLET
jgi:hypothetical protein